MLCFVLLPLFIGFVLLLISGATELADLHRLNTSQATAQGTIIAHRRGSAGSMNQGILHYVTYQFMVDEVQVKKEQFVPRLSYQRLKDGASVTVKYVPSNPQLATLTGQDADVSLGAMSFTQIVIGLVGGTIVLVYLLPALFRLWWAFNLRLRGTILHGEVLACHRYQNSAPTGLAFADYGSALNSTFFVELSYRFHTPPGRIIQGRCTQQREDLRGKALPKFGMPVYVLYLNDAHYQVL